MVTEVGAIPGAKSWRFRFKADELLGANRNVDKPHVDADVGVPDGIGREADDGAVGLAHVHGFRELEVARAPVAGQESEGFSVADCANARQSGLGLGGARC
jgi:hypothetical protein